MTFRPKSFPPSVHKRHPGCEKMKIKIDDAREEGEGGPPVGTEDFSEPGIFFSPGNWSRSGSAKNIFGE